MLQVGTSSQENYDFQRVYPLTLGKLTPLPLETLSTLEIFPALLEIGI